MEPLTFGPVILSGSDSGVAEIAMQEPTLTAGMARGLAHAFEAVAGSQARVVLLSGPSEHFCLGADRSVLSDLQSGKIPLDELDLPRLLLDCPLPVVVAMQGAAIGGGFALGLGGDVVVLAQEQRYGFNFASFGLTPGMGATDLAAHVLGPALATDLLLTGALRRGRDLARVAPGLGHAYPAELVPQKARALALRIADQPADVPRLLKSRLVAPRRAGFRAARQAEMQMHRLCLRRGGITELVEENYAG